MKVSNSKDYLTLYRSWRSLWQNWLLAILLGLLTIYLTVTISGLILTDKIFGVTIELPVLGLLWLFTLARPLMLIWDSEYLISPHHIKATHGKVSIKKECEEYAFEDLVGVRTRSSIMGRILGYGDIVIGSKDSTVESVELVGIANPEKYQPIISARIDNSRIEERKQPKLVLHKASYPNTPNQLDFESTPASNKIKNKGEVHI